MNHPQELLVINYDSVGSYSYLKEFMIRDLSEPLSFIHCTVTLPPIESDLVLLRPD